MAKSTKQTNNQTAMIVGGLAAVGLSIGGLMLASTNAETANNTNVQSQTESVINLPATNEKVNGLEGRLDSTIESFNNQINRRELETYQYIETLDEKKKERVEGLEIRLYRLEQEIFDMVP